MVGPLLPLKSPAAARPAACVLFGYNQMRTRSGTVPQVGPTDGYTAKPAYGGTILTFRVVIEPDEDGVFVAEVPALPGCISQGRTRTEAIENIKEPIIAYLESLKNHSEPIPPPISEETVEVSI